MTKKEIHNHGVPGEIACGVLIFVSDSVHDRVNEHDPYFSCRPLA